MFLGYTSCRSPILPGSREFVYPSLLKRPDFAHRTIALDRLIQHDPVDRYRRLWSLEASQSLSNRRLVAPLKRRVSNNDDCDDIRHEWIQILTAS
jgi:hypothetical protein